MLEFLKYYWQTVLRKGWSFLLGVPYLLKFVPEFDLAYGFNISPIIKILNDYLIPWWKWIIIFVFFLLHVKAIYDLWKRKESPLLQGDIPDKYENIAKKLDIFLGEKTMQIREDFAHGNECLTGEVRKDINTAICIHFGAYKNIRDGFQNLLRNGKITMTTEMSTIKEKFEMNYSYLKKYNDDVGRNNSSTINYHDIRKLIDDINDNLNSLFAHLC